MYRASILHKIGKLLAIFEDEIKMANLNGVNSISIQTEELLRKLLNTAYGLNLQNANAISKSYPAIDLIDDTKKIAVQITSIGTVSKVVHALRAVDKYGLDELYFYSLKGMDNGVNSANSRIISEKGNFDIHNIHFLDNSRFYQELEINNDLETLDLILELLENEFSSTIENTDIKDNEVLELLRRIDNGYELTEEERKILSDVRRIEWHDIVSIPRSIELLSGLEYCSLSGELNSKSCLKSLPKEIGKLGNLKSLNLKRTQIRELPETIGDLKRLQILDLSYTWLNILPDEIGKLQDIRSLDLNYSTIRKLPETLKALTGLEDFSVHGCVNLTGELYLPDGMKSIESDAFSGCAGLSGELQFPTCLTSIGDEAFSGCVGLSGELRLPPNLKIIGARAFSDCIRLTGELRLPQGLMSLGDGAFKGCSGLSRGLRLPYYLESIGDSAFKGCSGLDGVSLSNNMKNIGASAFEGCSGLRGDLHLPDNLASIGASAFKGCSGLDGILRLPYYLESIGDSTFEGCSGLRGDLRLPDNLASIGESAFKGCSGLRGDLHLPVFLASIGESAFKGCSGLDGNLSLPYYLKSIGASTFEVCSGLRGDLHLPDNLASIGACAFKGCSGLDGNLSLPHNLASIGASAFEGCSGLRGDLSLPYYLESIGDSAFKGCSGLDGDLRLPDKMESIGDSAFEGCSGLRGDLRLPDKMESIGDSAFEGCSGLSGDLRLPDNLASIGASAFKGCSGLSGDLYLPPCLTNIEEESFSGCTGLNGILRLPENIESIGERAFYGCNNLTGSLDFPAHLIVIATEAFSGCFSLRGELYLPEELLAIGEGAFYGCRGLNGDLYLPKNLMSLSTDVFNGCIGLNGKVYFPESLLSIGKRAFYGCNGLKGLQLPPNLGIIDDEAFEGCSSLSGELHLPEGLMMIGNSSFSGCSNISGGLLLPNNLISIGAEAFNGCNSIIQISRLPETIEKIGIGAFNGISIEKNEDEWDCPAAIFDSSLARKKGILELEYEQADLIGRYYIRIEKNNLVVRRKVRKSLTSDASLPIPSIYSYVFGVLKDKLYYSCLDDNQVYSVLKATGSQSRREYAKQFNGNHKTSTIYDWYNLNKAVEGDYIVVSVYEDNELVLDYISKNKRSLLKKYGLDGLQGNLSLNSVIKETGTEFRLISLLVRNDNQLIMDYQFFPEDDIKASIEPVTTIIVGENGSGKSYTLKILSEIFLAVQNENTRNNLAHTYYKLVYSLHGKIVSIEIAQKRVGIHVGKELIKLEDAKKVLPEKVLALAFMLNDKYIFRRDVLEDDIYEYLGIRGASNAAWTSTFGNRVAENIITLVNEGTLWNIIKRLSEYLHIDPKISVTVEVKDKQFVEKDLSIANIQKFILDGLDKESIERSNSARVITTKNRVEKNIERYSDILFKLLHDRSQDNGNRSVCEIVFDEIDNYSKIKENESIYDALRDLYLLQIVSDTTLYIYKDRQKFMFDEVSSGEKNILYAILTIAGHIKNNSLVMIDEPEISLHPNWQMLYVSLLKSVFKDYGSCHFLIATHSPYMVSDLNPDSSSLITLFNNHGEREMRTIDYSTYSWSVENILYNVFHVRTTRNYYFEMDLRELITLIEDNGNKDLVRIKELYKKLSRYVYDQKDPLQLILQQVEEQLINAES